MFYGTAEGRRNKLELITQNFWLLFLGFSAIGSHWEEFNNKLFYKIAISFLISQGF